ncbi:MAG: hypothetical protein AABP62_16985 [Planctomycetota bacterium]
MTRIILRSPVGVDGVLRLAVPVGSAAAECQMQVTIESIPTEAADSSDYINWLDRIAGQWQGDFERLPAIDFEQRDSL